MKGIISRILRVTPLVALLLLLLLLLLEQSSVAASERDKFVEASPLVVALACRDGVALVAAHTNDAPLLCDDDDDKVQHEEPDDTCFFRDLPGTFCGPFRLQTIGTGSAALLTAGWRADAKRLVDVARALDSDERDSLGGDDDQNNPRVLASDLSRYMASCQGSDGVSCCLL